MKMVRVLGPGAFTAKADIRHAFRRADWPLLCYMWEGHVYVALRLPIGVRASPSSPRRYSGSPPMSGSVAAFYITRRLLPNTHFQPRVLPRSTNFQALVQRPARPPGAREACPTHAVFIVLGRVCPIRIPKRTPSGAVRPCASASRVLPSSRSPRCNDTLGNTPPSAAGSSLPKMSPS